VSGTGASDCIGGWRITGYYTPEESDLSGSLETIQLCDERLIVFRRTFFKEPSSRVGPARATDGFSVGPAADRSGVHRRSTRMVAPCT
jgi:hypothetical protein